MGFELATISCMSVDAIWEELHTPLRKLRAFLIQQTEVVQISYANLAFIFQVYGLLFKLLTFARISIILLGKDRLCSSKQFLSNTAIENSLYQLNLRCVIFG